VLGRDADFVRRGQFLRQREFLFGVRRLFLLKNRLHLLLFRLFLDDAHPVQRGLVLHGRQIRRAEIFQRLELEKNREPRVDDE
jgi:hypothetical protein